MNLLRTGLVIVLLALGGCVETRFESPPGDNLESCDARWKGLWIGDDEKPKDSNTAFSVDDGCRFMLIDQPEKGGPFKEIRIPVNFVHADGKDYVVVSDVALKGLVRIAPPYAIDPAPEKSFYITRYQVRGDAIDLYSVNDQRMAQKVIEGKLEGTVAKTSNELHVFIRGDRAKVLDILRHDTIFNDKSQLHLLKSRQTVAEFERAAMAAQKSNK